MLAFSEASCRESRDERQVRVLVERLWDLSRTEAQASFWHALERGEDDVHYLHEWEELLSLVGSRQRFEELQEFLDNAQQIVAPDWIASDLDQGDRETEEETDAAALLDQDQETIPDHQREDTSSSDDWDEFLRGPNPDLMRLLRIRRLVLERHGLSRDWVPGGALPDAR